MVAEPTRVLVVDDEEDSRELIAEMLRDQDGVTVVGAASNVQEAVDLVRVLRPDIVILDWIMPNGGGPKAATDIRAACPETRILGISAGDPSHASHEMMMGGAAGFVPKGCSVEELASAIKSVLRW